MIDPPQRTDQHHTPERPEPPTRNRHRRSKGDKRPGEWHMDLLMRRGKATVR